MKIFAIVITSLLLSTGVQAGKPGPATCGTLDPDELWLFDPHFTESGDTWCLESSSDVVSRDRGVSSHSIEWHTMGPPVMGSDQCGGYLEVTKEGGARLFSANDACWYYDQSTGTDYSHEYNAGGDLSKKDYDACLAVLNDLAVKIAAMTSCP